MVGVEDLVVVITRASVKNAKGCDRRHLLVPDAERLDGPLGGAQDPQQQIEVVAEAVVDGGPHPAREPGHPQRSGLAVELLPRPLLEEGGSGAFAAGVEVEPPGDMAQERLAVGHLDVLEAREAADDGLQGRPGHAFDREHVLQLGIFVEPGVLFLDGRSLATCGLFQSREELVLRAQVDVMRPEAEDTQLASNGRVAGHTVESDHRGHRSNDPRDALDVLGEEVRRREADAGTSPAKSHQRDDVLDAASDLDNKLHRELGKRRHLGGGKSDERKRERRCAIFVVETREK